jgi:hypothetical protein
MIAGVIESFVDLTYRGLSLGRRIRLSQVRPSSGALELSAPMPVGTQIAIATDDGVSFDATVTWIHEQVGGSDRPPGMTVAPALTAALAAAWWSARVVLPDDEAASATQVTADAGADPGRSATHAHSAPTVAMPALELPAEAFPDRGPSGEPAVVTDPAALGEAGPHDVIEDGNRTMIMAPVDLATLGLDAGATGEPGATSDATGAAGGAGGDEGADAAEPVAHLASSTLQPPGRGRKKRRLRR